MHSLIRLLCSRLGVDPMAWRRDTRRMRELVQAFDTGAAAKPDALHFAIVLTPWMGTAVPWFSLVTGLFLAANGNQVTFIVDDMPFAGDRLGSWFQLRCVRSVLDVLGPRFAVIALSDYASTAPLSDAARSSIDRLAALNAVWALRGEMAVAGRERITARAARQLRASYHPIGNVIQGGKYDVMFVPGGVWGSTGLWTEHARAAGVRVASYDSGGYGNLLLAVNGIACQLQDIPRAFAMLKSDAEAHQRQQFIVESALAEIGRRRAGVDKFSSQIQGTSNTDTRYAGGVLIALNSSWDSAALGLHEVFASSSEWIVETVRYLLENTSAPVIVRQHPVERLEIARTSDDYRGLLATNFGAHPRLHFIAADEAVNSYDLLEQVAAVAVYTSTIGIEAAAHGKPVITASRSYYSELGFVCKATSVAQYRQYLADAVAGRLPVTAAMRDDALACYYLTQCCNWIFTPFTVPEFHEWMAQDLAQIHQEDSVKRIVQGLEQNIPAAFLNHMARVGQQGR
jgi:hypothetical protein